MAFGSIWTLLWLDIRSPPPSSSWIKHGILRSTMSIADEGWMRKRRGKWERVRKSHNEFHTVSQCSAIIYIFPVVRNSILAIGMGSREPNSDINDSIWSVGIPLHIRCDLPLWIMQTKVRQYSNKKALIPNANTVWIYIFQALQCKTELRNSAWMPETPKEFPNGVVSRYELTKATWCAIQLSSAYKHTHKANLRMWLNDWQ